MNRLQAPGAPGIVPRWTSSAKVGIGTAYSASSPVWFTLSHGIINEIYYPHVDSPNTRDLQFLISDGETFCHEEKRDLIHQCERPDPDAMLYRLTSTERDGRYRIVKEVISQPHSPVVMMSVKVQISDESLKGKLKLYALLAPHVKNTGAGNTATVCGVAGQHFLHAEREDVHLILGCSTDFVRRSVGYVGTSDGWHDLKDNFQMDWQYEVASDGNVAMTGEIDIARGAEFTIGVSFGDSKQSAATALLQAFAKPFPGQRAKFIEQWKRTEQPKLSDDPKTSSLVRLSQHVLMAHEDKTFSGATVASMSIPWGDTKDDSDAGGYHLVWARDMVQTTTALLACGETELPLRALVWLASIQASDGGMPQNSAIDGAAYWRGVQLDEVAAPVVLAWRLKEANAQGQFDPTTMIRRAMRFLILHGPVTAQERWEENSGYSPSTLATIISSVVCAADLMRSQSRQTLDDVETVQTLASSDTGEIEFLLDYADWMVASLIEWTVTTCGELVAGHPRHFVRITPEATHPGSANPDPDTAVLQVANGGGDHPARNVVDAGFLQLVRMGILAWNDPIVVDSIEVIDAVLKRDLPQGPCWRRYNHDGYGNHDDGSAFNGTGVGRVWPLITGERGHYEIAAGRDVTPYIKAMEGFASDGGLLAEQLWDADDIPEHELFFGSPAGSAMPLCWAHAEYISLVRSQKDGACFDRIEPVYQRYAHGNPNSDLEFWTFAHQPMRIAKGKSLRIVCETAGSVHWSFDDWATRQDTTMKPNEFGLFSADIPCDSLGKGGAITFTFHWDDERWEGQDYVVAIS
ncbi:glycoside hydrolase family 15 protein [Planctomycetes bacterium TBK1r]|uniref:Glucoamylase n=1 Tax=Stieleria magnilauensis TaxID=2527963 RepID=A0ABX5XYR0_9BACT|nr:Glucoamylase precursor [Planctomycetes bacterium TBK1r]